jgi:hypothetical protein
MLTIHDSLRVFRNPQNPVQNAWFTVCFSALICWKTFEICDVRRDSMLRVLWNILKDMTRGLLNCCEVRKTLSNDSQLAAMLRNGQTSLNTWWAAFSNVSKGSNPKKHMIRSVFNVSNCSKHRKSRDSWPVSMFQDTQNSLMYVVCGLFPCFNIQYLLKYVIHGPVQGFEVLKAPQYTWFAACVSASKSSHSRGYMMRGLFVSMLQRARSSVKCALAKLSLTSFKLTKLSLTKSSLPKFGNFTCKSSVLQSPVPLSIHNLDKGHNLRQLGLTQRSLTEVNLAKLTPTNPFPQISVLQSSNWRTQSYKAQSYKDQETATPCLYSCSFYISICICSFTGGSPILSPFDMNPARPQLGGVLSH